MDDDLTDLGDELAMDENVATTLERFEMAWSPCLPMQLTWLTYEMAETLELIGRGDLRDIGSRMERHEINRTVAIMAGLAHLMEGYGWALTGSLEEFTESDDEWD